MALPKRRGVTRGYVWMLIVGCAVLSVALLVALWGFTALITLTFPVETRVPNITAPAIVLVILAGSIWSMWAQSLQLLRGHTTVPITRALLVGLGAYLVWCVLGSLFGLGVFETWASPFAIELVAVMIVAALCCWWVLLRRVYTTRPTPRWPWERDEAEREIDELNDLWRQSSDEGDDDTPPQERL